MRKIKLCFLCLVLMLSLTACGEKSELESILENVALSETLPEPAVVNCDYLDEADDAVYEQQLAACELYYEALKATETTYFMDLFGEGVDEQKLAAKCNARRSELFLDIDTQLNDNIYEMIRSVADCENVYGYIDRCIEDAFGFFDYYADYQYGDDRKNAVCTIMKVFHERSNIFAFRFMAEHKEEFVVVTMERILQNAAATTDYNMYIAENNELIKALNNVYGGVGSDYAYIITKANAKLIRNMLQEDNTLDEASIDTLMKQLGEAEPTEAPTPTPDASMMPTQAPVTSTPAPATTQKPAPTQAPVVTPRPTPVPTPKPVVTPVPVPTPTPQVYDFEI